MIYLLGDVDMSFLWFDKGFFSRENKNNLKSFGSSPSKLKVGILGTGKIGTDLLVKVLRSSNLECILFSGRNLQSEGMQYAASLGVPVSDKGIYAFINDNYRCDVVFDATSAAYHIEHALILEELGTLAIDMTPSQIGECVVPAIGMDEVHQHTNISMISCGGQASIPIAYVMSTVLPEISNLSVSSTVSSDSIGPGTLANIEEYYKNTRTGLSKYTGVAEISVELLVDDVNVKNKMSTTVIAKTTFNDLDLFKQALNSMLSKVQEYVPGYSLESVSYDETDGLKVVISVEGLGDYLPKYAGNLDIINCAAIAVAEKHAERRAETSESEIAEIY